MGNGSSAVDKNRISPVVSSERSNKEGGELTLKFEKLEVWKLSMEYLDEVYRLTEKLPRGEYHNLRNQWIRSATSIALNIAEGSTGQTDSDQARFLGYAIRSLSESTACYRISQRRNYLSEEDGVLERLTMTLIKKLQSFRNAVRMKGSVRRI
jgi:four helix bundle protein